MTILRDPELRQQGFRVLTVTQEKVLWASRGYRVYRSDDAARTFVSVAEYAPGQLGRLVARSRLAERLLRGGFHSLVVRENGTLVGIVPKWVVRADPGARSFDLTFGIPRGIRPLGLASTPWGHLYFGEYFNNRHREEVHIYASEDTGRTWEVCYTFPAQTIRHVHNVIHDPYQPGLWVLTGDVGDECRVLFTSDRFRTLEAVLVGGQHARAVTAVPRPDGIILPTDTELEQNYIYHLGRDGRLQQLAAISGSCFHACRAGNLTVVSTVVEPSRVNTDRHATLFVSANGSDWQVLYRSKKDFYPAKFFLYGMLLLPTGQNDTGYLFATGVSLASDDNVLLRWSVHDQDTWA